MSLADELRAEIKKWTERLDERIPKTVPVDNHGKRMLENLKAYRGDSGHFSERGDLVRSFECLVWAWALLETGNLLGHLKTRAR
jgi:hypothetical protein